MLGKRYLLDTNALVALLQGHPALLALTAQAEWLGTSVINVLEFLSFDGLSDADKTLFNALTARISVVDLNFADTALMAHVTNLRNTRAVKLPDAIVMASALIHEAKVVTQDAQLLKLSTSDPRYQAQGF